LAIASVFALVVNIEIAIVVNKGQWRLMGGKLGHVGIAVFLLGVLVSGKYTQTERFTLSPHQPHYALGRTFTLLGWDVRADGKTAYKINVEQEGKSLTLEPVMFEAGMQGIMKNPDIATTFTRDLYVSPLSYEQAQPTGEAYTLKKDVPIAVGAFQLRLTSFDIQGEQGSQNMMAGGDMKIGAVIEVLRGGDHEVVTPLAVVRAGRAPEFTAVRSVLLGADVQLAGMDLGAPEGAAVSINLEQPDSMARSGSLWVDVSIKPWINLVWLGTVIMLLGCAVAITKRLFEGERV
jgi:cytochrome c-type biogenesis protein CcmF